ncbi:MAG: FKBP-type peptidyl-prolyl cis-trans isomerase [Ginsengibacter sp.]
MRVQNQTVVSLRYVMKNAAGEILEDNMHTAPVQYVHGSGKILPSLESSLHGLEAGDKKVVSLKTGDAPGTEDFTFDVVIDDVREASKDEILHGEPVKETIAVCGPGCNC